MSEILTEEDVAAILKFEREQVTELFETQQLSGFKWGNRWRTTEDMLKRDIEILTNEARVENMRKDSYRTPWELSDAERKTITSPSTGVVKPSKSKSESQ